MRRFALALAAALLAPAAIGHAEETVVVSNRVIYPGETVSAEMLDDVPLRRQLRNPAMVVMDGERLVGKVARRTILPGRLIATNSVREAYLVEPGEAVQVVFTRDNLEISVTGMPLQSGAAGDTIRLRNADSGTVFDGVIAEDGTVRIPSS